MDSLFEIEIQSAGMQVLESSYIIATSKNMETIKSRFDFLSKRIESLKLAQNNSQYLTSIQLPTENYQALYHDRPIQEYQYMILTNPQGFELIDFYCRSLLNGMKRFCEEQRQEINEMKKNAAKIKRTLKVLETISTIKREVHIRCATALSFTIVLAELEYLENTFNKIV